MITLENPLNGTLNNLSDNMMFRLSLTSKELFHSNFWAWLLEEYPDSAKVFYNDYSNEDTVSKVLREKNNTDLSFWINEELIIIENKFKSFPDLEQLKKYAKSHSKLKRMILISFYKPLFLNPDTKSFTQKYSQGCEIWHYQDEEANFEIEYVSYDIFNKRLSNFAKSLVAGDNKIFIENYIQMLDLLTQLKKDLSLKNHPEKTYGDFSTLLKDTQSEAKKINFDAVLKKIFFHELLSDLLEGTKYFILPLKKVDYSDRAQSVYMTMMFKTDEETIKHMGIELCENQFRKYIQANKEYENQDRKELESKIELSPKYRWFYQNCHGRNIITNGGFWGYNYKDDAWLYKICDEFNLSEMTFAELKSTIIQELEKIEQNIKVKY